MESAVINKLIEFSIENGWPEDLDKAHASTVQMAETNNAGCVDRSNGDANNILRGLRIHYQRAVDVG